MIVIPAIDLQDGHCVRLRQGRMQDVSTFSDNPLATAERWYNAGARRLHIVDLDGALHGQPKHSKQIQAILDRYPDMDLEVGGGIRDENSIKTYLDAGARWVILGTAAMKNPEFVEEMCCRYEQRIIIGMDARAGRLASEGWVEKSDVLVVELAQRFSSYPVAAFIYTDIDKDGMMSGVNRRSTVALAKSVSIPIIASGGVRHLRDIVDLRDEKCVHGVIVGRALYEGGVDLSEALAAV